MKKDNLAFFGFLLGVFCVVTVATYFFIRTLEEHQLKIKMRYMAIGTLASPTEVIVSENFVIDYGIMTDRSYRYAKVTSPGLDKKWDTDDDLTVEERDYNKSKMVGEFLGKRIKEVGQGFVEGLKEDSDFSVDNGEK